LQRRVYDALSGRRHLMGGIVGIVVVVLIVLFVLGYFGRGRFRG
jgi:small-conductance mechanosensitive channel